MIETTSWLLFLAASTALILVPGPSQALVIAKTLASGRRAGALTAVGLNMGTLCHAAAAAVGLSALLATSALAFSILKYLGAAYLVYLGIRAWRSAPATAAASAPPPAASPSRTLVQAILAGILNPKVAIFFAAFLPQFVDATRSDVFMQFMLLGATMAVLDTLYELAIVFTVARLRERHVMGSRFAAWQGRVSGAVMLGLGCRLALQER